MKEYKKPAMLALSLSANDALCGCSDDAKSSYAVIHDYLIGLGLNPGDDNTFQRDELGNLFSAHESCEKLAPGLEEYCKFTSTKQLFTS